MAQHPRDCYLIDETDVLMVIKHLASAGYQATPHWHLTRYAKTVPISDTRCGLHLFISPKVTDSRFSGSFTTRPLC